MFLKEILFEERRLIEKFHCPEDSKWNGTSFYKSIAIHPFYHKYDKIAVHFLLNTAKKGTPVAKRSPQVDSGYGEECINSDLKRMYEL